MGHRSNFVDFDHPPPYRLAAERPSLPRSGPVGRLLHRLRAWNDARRTRLALSGLDDQVLEDLGLTRRDIAGLNASTLPSDIWHRW